MASLSIRNIDDSLYERLKHRAARHGVSMEEEVRRIIARAVQPPERLGDLFIREFGARYGVELPAAPREPHDPIDF